MMLQPTEEEIRLHKEYSLETDPEKLEEIRKKLHEIHLKRDEELKDCPFVH